MDFSPQQAFARVLPEKPLLCFVYDKHKPGGIATSWDDPALSPFPPLMVANPILGKAAYTTSGRLSARALANVGVRQFLVLEFDSGSKDAHAAIIWHLGHRWRKHDVELRMVLDSGRRSLHSWFDVRHLNEKQIWQLCRYAYQLGADRATFGKAQLVRVPGAWRPEESKRQLVYFIRSKDENNRGR
jgi:hypothetical protein